MMRRLVVRPSRPKYATAGTRDVVVTCRHGIYCNAIDTMKDC